MTLPLYLRSWGTHSTHRRLGESISVIAGPCNHRSRVGNLKTRGPEIDASGPVDPIEKALRNFPAEGPTQEGLSPSTGRFSSTWIG